MEQLDRDYLARYQRLPASDPDLVYFLGDRYEFSRTWSAPSNSLPTFRRNTGKFLHRQSLTFLCPQDKLAALGWPMTLGTANEMGTTPFPALDPHRADEMAGNSMHLTCAAVVLMLGLACFGRQKQSACRASGFTCAAPLRCWEHP